MNRLRSFAVAAALALWSSSAAHAQRVALQAGTSETPTCAELGVQRVAVMVPPGQSRADVRALVSQNGTFPEGTQVVILDLGDYTPLQNEEDLRFRMNRVFLRFMDQGIRIDGTVNVQLTVDEAGTVTSARSGLRNRPMDRMLSDAWMHARFAPYTIDGCRVRAWISIPFSLTSDWSLEVQRQEMRIIAP